MKTRRAVTLVELLIVMTTGSVVLTATTVLIHQAMRAQRQAWSFYDVERTALRLSRQFRHDVRAAGRFELIQNEQQTKLDAGNRTKVGAAVDAAEIMPPDPADEADAVFLRLHHAANQTVEYRRQDEAVLRLVKQRGDVVSRSAFRFPPNARLAVRQASKPPRLILTLSTEPPAAASQTQSHPARYAIPLELEAAAVLGRDLPHIKPAMREKTP